MKNSKIIVFIHGLFMNPKCWEEWMAYFEKEGYVCHAPAYPFHDGSPKELRNKIDSRLGKVTFNDVLNVYEAYINGLPEKPILIGHSMGGLLVQKLIEMDRGSLGICISSAPPLGIFTFKWSFLKSNLPMVNFLKGNTVSVPNIKWFHYSVCNTLSLEETRQAYDKYVVPESRNIPRTGTKVNFKKSRAPLLFIAAEKDHVVPPILNLRNYKAYKNSSHIKEYKEFSKRTHFICWQSGCEEVRGYIASWINKVITH